MQSKWSDLLKEVNAYLTPAKEVVIVLKPNPDIDAVGASLALAQALRKIGRKTSIVCSTKISGMDQLQGKEEILSDLPQKQLEVIINYTQGSFERGEIQKTNKGLQVNLLSHSGQNIIEPLNVNYKPYESKPDVIITVDIENLAHLQEFYTQNQGFFGQVPIINIDYHANNARYGKVNLLDPKASCVSEMVTLMLYDLRVAMDENIAENLYQGMAHKTNNFASQSHSANLLEAASICLRYKQAAQRMPVMPQSDDMPSQDEGQFGGEQSSANPTSQPPTPATSNWSQSTGSWK